MLHVYIVHVRCILRYKVDVLQAWIRVALNEGVMESYLDAMLADKKTLRWVSLSSALTQIARHWCGGWATGGPAVAATGAGGPPVVHPRCAIWEPPV